MGIGLPKFVGQVVKEGEKLARSVPGRVDAGGDAVKNIASHAAHALAHDGFQLANNAFKHITSSPNKKLVKRELELAQLASDARRTPAQRGAARTELRRLMGAEPETALDPLPASCSPAAEKARAKSAQVWDPSKEPPTAKAQWATGDPAGRSKSDPVNFYVHGNLADIVRAFQKGGWSIANPLDGPSCEAYKHAMEGFVKQWGESKVPLLGPSQVTQAAYHAVNQMPVSTLYLNGQPELVSLEANNHPLTGRDHFRIFATGKKDAQGRNIYAVAASRDAGIELDPKSRSTGYTDHFTQKNADTERDFTLQTLLAGGAQVRVDTTSRDFSGGPPGGLHSDDGKVYDVVVG